MHTLKLNDIKESISVEKEQKLMDLIIEEHKHDLSSKLTDSQCLSIDITISSEIPIGAGLGSSAAFSIALSTSLYLSLQLFLGNSFQEEQVKVKARQYADFLERLIHTNPSGVDVAISLNGNMLQFVKGTTPQENTITML
jgi:mevalonate kinase